MVMLFNWKVLLERSFRVSAVRWGYIDVDHFESEPFDAALIALAPLWKKCNFHKLENFFNWERIFRKGNEDNIIPNLFVEELNVLVSNLLDQ